MKLGFDCHQCLAKLVNQAAEMATPDLALRERAREEGLSILHGLFSYDKVSPDIANDIHRVLRRVTGNADPYRQMKDKEIKMSRHLFQEVRPRYGNDLRSCIEIAALGNTIDFFKEPDRISEDMRKPVVFTMDHVGEFERKLRKAEKVLYLADNAGECFFDMPLIEKMRETTQVTYVVKGSPVQNDITLEDLKKAGLGEKIGDVMTTGGDTVGVNFTYVSEEFKTQFELADLIFAKGMGHYETLTEIHVYGKIVYCFMAKCQVIADSLKVPLNSFIAMLR